MELTHQQPNCTRSIRKPNKIGWWELTLDFSDSRFAKQDRKRAIYAFNHFCWSSIFGCGAE